MRYLDAERKTKRWMKLHKKQYFHKPVAERKLSGPVVLIIEIILIMIGIALILYPWISNYVYEKRAVSEISVAEAEVDEMSDTEVDEIIAAAQKYNAKLKQGNTKLTDPFIEALESDNDEEYYSLLMYSSTGVMGWIDIPVINVYLPVYHGTSSDVLTSGIGHLEGSSLPVGGESTHAVLTGHTGLSSAKLFTDLTELEEGDMFYFHILDEILAYRVVEIQVCDPDNTDPLRVQEGRDLMTLVTCTPYGINSHRLYVTGERTEYIESEYEVVKNKKSKDTGSLWMRSYRNAIIIGIFISIVLYICVRLILWRRRMKHNINID